MTNKTKIYAALGLDLGGHLGEGEAPVRTHHR